MLLAGSCHCGAVTFRLRSAEPVPYQRCYCSICSKTGGAGGYMINLGGDAKTLEVEGRDHVRVYRAMIDRDGERTESAAERHFCGRCGSHLWAFHPQWPELVHPVASAIDTRLPAASENVHLMVGSKASWVTVEGKAHDGQFDEYPQESLADWHKSRGLDSTKD